jgi:hypothetical protein
VIAGAGTGNPAMLCQGNSYWPMANGIEWGTGIYQTLAAWRAAADQEILGAEATGTDEDPGLAAPGTAPAVTSPASFAGAAGMQASGVAVRGTGLDLAGLFGLTVGSQDAFGNTLSVPLWAGAYQGVTVTPGAFPDGPLGAEVELLLGTEWTAITPYVAYKKQAITVTRGHPDESTTTTPSSMAAALDNTGKRFTSKNPAGAFYGLLGRNVPVRVSVPEAAPYLRIEGDAVSYAQAPDSAALSVTGDTEVVLDATLDNWRAAQVLACKWADTGNQVSWMLLLNENGTLNFRWSNSSTTWSATSTVSVPWPALRRQVIDVTMAYATGTVKFYTAPTIGGSYAQLGATVVVGATAGVYNSTAPVQLGFGTDTGTGYAGIYGQVHEFLLKNGIGGTIVADANFANAAAGAASFTDAYSNTWTCEGTAEISGRKYRFHGEASAWTPAAEGTTGLDLWCGLTAGGLLRRIQQNTQTLGSAFTRALPSAVGLVGYWPCEDGNTTSSGATPATPTQFASAVQGVAAGTFTGGPPQFASDQSFLCSQALPVISKSRWHFVLPSRSAADTANVFRFLMHMPSSSDTNDGVIARMYTTGTIGTLDLLYTTGGGLTLNGYSQTGATLFSDGPDAFGTDGTPMWVSLELQKSGSSVQYSVVTLLPGATSGSAMTGTLSSASIGNASELIINGNSGTASLSGTALGQITYQTVWQSLFGFYQQLDAYQGEAAGQRFSRLCSEQAIPFRGVGSLDDTVAMGAQTPLAFSDLLQECVDADVGMMFEPRQALALGYRTRASLQNQAAAAALDYSTDGLTGLLTPTEDDQYTKNDVTATRAYVAGGGTGSSSEAVITEGPLSVQSPPDGVGPYLDSVTVNVQLDSQLADAAGWRAWLGTVNEPRYPSIPYDLARQDIGSNLYAIPDVDIGDRVTIGNTPPWEPPDGISQLASQCAETIGERSYSIAWVGVPETPYQTAVVSDLEYGRVDTDGSVLYHSCSATATSIQVEVVAGAPLVYWTTNAADFPFDIAVGGERMTVTNIVGVSSPQTFTVTRSVNGVVASHNAGEAVSLFTPAIVSL